MKILGLDTALGALSVALIEDGRTLAHENREMSRGHAEELAPMAERVMRGAGVEFADLDRLAVTTGPGTFTGQRVGLAFARALKLALDIPLAGITTLDAMAAAALEESEMIWAVAAHDAKRGEIYLGARSRDGETLIEPELILLGEAAARIAGFAPKFGTRLALAGTAMDVLAPLLGAAGLDPWDSGVRQPDALFVARLAALLPDAALDDIPKPLYLRAPDAKLPVQVP